MGKISRRMKTPEKEELANKGFTLTTLPGLKEPVYATYSKVMPNGVTKEFKLPADPYSLAHYKTRGFKLKDLPADA